MRSGYVTLIMVVLITCFVSCKEKEVFVEPGFILKKWTEAARDLNHREYAKYEAYPKSQQVFAESFSEFYPDDLMILKIEEINEKNVFTDHNGDRYNKRNVQFKFTQINRKTRNSGGHVLGDVDFVKYIDGENNNRGWLMLNRTLIRVYE